ncbi:hypothetical protein K1T71_014224 [Dendrolimus kikuchii]|uniref:Uncharacterized protein n=1 Tax=Dendrolimus kikuchii TaxID=765133 RepID=A0ACC1CFF7_9NEOP|nr:hypothetical protein K1T71_014224 [Dendrolimus kikuchii]
MVPSSVRQKERKFLIEIIQLYRSLPVLWNVNIKEYHDRQKKNNAYNILLRKYRQMYPEATKEDVKKKFNSLRTNYRKELKKYHEWTNSGNKGEYQPSSWYFEEMSFLEEQHCDSNLSNIIDNIEREDRVTEDATTSDDAQTPNKVLKTISRPNKFKKLNMDLELPMKRIKLELDEYQNWAMVCAADLKRMEPMQQIYAKKAIADILMGGQLGLLNRNSVQLHDPDTEDRIKKTLE